MQKSHFHLFYSSSFVTKMALLFTLSLCIVSSGIEIAHAGGEAQGQMQIPDTPRRIVVLPLFAEEILLEMIGPDRIVFVGHEYSENAGAYSPTMELTKHIRGSSDPDICAADFLDLKPDLVVLEKGNFSLYETLLPELEQAGIPVLFFDRPESMDDIMSTLTTLGEAVGAPEKAAQMVRDMECTLAQIAEIVSSIPEEKRVRAIHYENWQYNFDMVARAAGVINVNGSDDPDWERNYEQLVEWNPDLITVNPFFIDEVYLYYVGDDYVEKHIGFFLNDPVLSDVTAIRNRNVHPLSLHESQFVVQSVMDLARLAYPNLFSGQDN